MARISKHMIDLAIAQFTGFRCCEQTNNIDALVESMGLTAKEWAIIRGQVEWLGERNIQYVDEHFEQAA